MFLHRFALLIAMAWLGPGPGGDCSAPFAPPGDSHRSVVDPALCSSLVPTHLPRAGLTRLPAWRYRIKYVLEDKVAWLPRPVDRGPADLPDLIELRNGSPPIALRLGSLIPLRC